MRNYKFLLIILLVVTNTIGCMSAPAKKPPPNQPPSPPPPSTQSNYDSGQKDIIDSAKKFHGDVGIYAKSLNTGKTIAYNQNKIFPTASTHKLVVALAVYKYLYPQATTNQKKLYDNYVHKMIKVSDNPAFFALLDEIAAHKAQSLQQVLTDLKLTNTMIHNDKAYQKYGYHSVTTPYEMGVVMETIFHEQYLGPERSAVLKKELANTIFHDEIPRFMQTKVMHKIGQLKQLLCDVGIVDDGNQKILISIYTVTDKSEDYASQYIAETSAKIYKALK